jgi:hypothetical protein
MVNSQDNLTNMRACFHPSMRLRRLIQIKTTVDHWGNPTR